MKSGNGLSKELREVINGDMAGDVLDKVVIDGPKGQGLNKICFKPLLGQI